MSNWYHYRANPHLIAQADAFSGIGNSLRQFSQDMQNLHKNQADLKAQGIQNALAQKRLSSYDKQLNSDLAYRDALTQSHLRANERAQVENEFLPKLKEQELRKMQLSNNWINPLNQASLNSTNADIAYKRAKMDAMQEANALKLAQLQAQSAQGAQGGAQAQSIKDLLALASSGLAQDKVKQAEAEAFVDSNLGYLSDEDRLKAIADYKLGALGEAKHSFFMPNSYTPQELSETQREMLAFQTNPAKYLAHKGLLNYGNAMFPQLTQPKEQESEAQKLEMLKEMIKQAREQ